MTDFQALDLLRRAGIVGARPIEGSARLLLTLRRGVSTMELPLSEFRTELQNDLKSLDDEKQDVLNNVFASRVKTTFTIGDGQPTTMEALKRDDQLSPEEQAAKRSKLKDLEERARENRNLYQAVTHLQAHSAVLLPKLSTTVSVPLAGAPGGVARKELWAKGVKAAALYCLREGQRIKADDHALFVLCSEFLEKHIIDGEPGYTAETLFENVRQVRLLDTIE